MEKIKLLSLPEKGFYCSDLRKEKWVPFFEQYCRSKDRKDDRRAQNKNHTSWKNIHDPGSDRAVLQRRKILFRSSDRRIATVNSKGVVKEYEKDGRDHRAERSEKTEL